MVHDPGDDPGPGEGAARGHEHRQEELRRGLAHPLGRQPLVVAVLGGALNLGTNIIFSSVQIFLVIVCLTSTGLHSGLLSLTAMSRSLWTRMSGYLLMGEVKWVY